MTNNVSLIHVDVPMTEPFRISSGEVRSKESILVCIKCDGLAAYGEASPMSGGFYSEETPETTWEFLSDYIVPQVIHEKNLKPEFAIQGVERAGQNRFAWAGIEGALWDLNIQQAGKSFVEVLGASFAPIPSGLAVGIYPTVTDLLMACERHLEAGYRRLKIKIQPGWDLEPLRAVRDRFGNIDLMVDANASYAEEHFPVFDEIDELGLIMIEQPLVSDDLSGHARLQEKLKTPICLDESIKSVRDFELALRLGSCRVLNIKYGRVGGLSVAVRLHDMARDAGIPCWVGGMLESAVGAGISIELATLPNFTYPGDLFPSQRFYAQDLTEPPLRLNADCTFSPSTVPGTPYHSVPARVEAVTRLKAVLAA